MQKAKNYRNLILGCCMTGIVMLLAFFFLYHTYIQDIIYEERLNQMEEVTRQMFQNLEDVIDSHWDRVTEECNYLRDANIQTTDELCRHMKKKYELSAYADHKITLMAVDSEGGYYTESGKRGLFRDLDYFEESPEKTSFVFDSMTDNQSKMVFLNRLPEPIYLQNGEKKTSILYFGIAQDMEQLNPYFNCEAYNGNNSVYVLDDNGSKLFNSNQVELIKGHNVFSVLQNMKYLHNSSFEKTKAELEEKGCSYSNAVLDGTEYFYGLKRMENAEWTLIFLVPAEYVATNTLKLVNFVMVFIVIFTVIVAVCVMLGISFVMYRNQQEAIRVERDNNAKLETVNTKLRQAKQAAEDAFQVAQEANRSKSSFLANMSHDIRTPMNAIIGYAELASKHLQETDKLGRYLETIQICGERLLSLLSNVLDLARIENNKIEMEYDVSNVHENFENCVAMFQQLSESKNQTLSLTEQIMYPYVYMDAPHLSEVCLNIISNAIKYTNTGGTISCDVVQKSCEKDDWCNMIITITDNGIGMSEDFQKHIFEIFERERNSTVSHSEGSGIGMGITKKLVDLMDGTIEVKSKQGEGSIFTVTVPCRKASKEDSMMKKKSNLRNKNCLNGVRILLVEDNEINAEIATELLTEEGCIVETANDGVACIDMIEKADADYYKMILMDIQMPNMDGYRATEMIRGLSDKSKATIPIIAMTANAFEEDRKKALAKGMNGHIAKPIDAQILYEVLDKLAKKQQ